MPFFKFNPSLINEKGLGHALPFSNKIVFTLILLFRDYNMTNDINMAHYVYNRVLTIHLRFQLDFC